MRQASQAINGAAISFRQLLGFCMPLARESRTAGVKSTASIPLHATALTAQKLNTYGLTYSGQAGQCQAQIIMPRGTDLPM